MYNRYIPQNDGTFRRRPVQDQPSHRPSAPSPKKPEPPSPAPPPPKPPQQANVGGFLRQLLPKEFDTGDLIVVLLLLLMAGDCEEEKNTALLTLALYFFM
ncbi:MAG: hypothetical protein E7431_04330 [Ruminococcaceae bacterium]|nr:hypothetical protein [Oscillospiraceae bacterium]